MVGLSDKQEADARKAANVRWAKSAQAIESLPGEEWRAVPSYPGYEASSEGRVKSRHTVLRSHSANKFGHLYVAPSVDGKQKPEAVHRMVCEAFHGSCPPEHECRHLDGDTANNRPSNLTWGTKLENQRDRKRHGTHNGGERNGRAKLTADIARGIFEQAKAGRSREAVAAAYGVSVGQVGLIAGGFRWAEVTGAVRRGKRNREISQ